MFKYLLLVLPFSAPAQKGYNSLEGHGDVHLTSPTSTGGGFTASANFRLGPHRSYIGIGAGMAKVSDVKGLGFPVSLRLTAIGGKKERGAPLLMLLPGYLLYERRHSRDVVSGGFTFFGGMGMVINPGAAVALGYSVYNYEGWEQVEGVQLRLIALLQ